jgi:hypothetical protein
MTNHRNFLMASFLSIVCACNDRTQTDDGMCFYEDPQLGQLSWCDDQPPDDGPSGASRYVASASLPHMGDGSCDPCPGPELDDLLVENGRRGVHQQGASLEPYCTYERTRVLEVHRECHGAQPVGGRCGYQGYIWYVCDEE